MRKIKCIFFVTWYLVLCPFVFAATEPFPLEQVRLTDSRWHDNMQRDSAWVCSITSQQALHNFRTTVGMYSAKEGGYDTMQKMGGWESPDCDLRGHAVGHLLSAYGLFYAATGDSLFYLKGDSVVQGIRACQRYKGTGYVSAFPEGLIDRNIAGQSVWAPWYTLHKVMAGMLAQYRYCHNDTALVVVQDFARWAAHKLLRLDEPTRLRMLRNEFGGMPEVWLDLYAITGDDAALRLADFFYDTAKLDPLYQGNFDMGTMHTNTFLPKVIAEAKKSQIINHKSQMAEHFFHEMVCHHIMAPGILSDKEHFFPHGTMHKHLSAYTGETCCTYNILRLAQFLYNSNSNDIRYIQYIEQALVNDILGQQDPETGMVHYFLPMQTGAYKLYSTPMNSFWCCVGSSFESHAKYGENIYCHTGDTIQVNLWIPSTLNWEEKGLRLRQVTDFPRSSTTTLVVEQAPKQKITIMVRKDSTYQIVTRRFKAGDRITVQRDFALHTVAADGDSSRVALFYGPILLAGRLGHVEHPFSDPNKHNDYYTYDYQVPDSIKSVELKDVQPVPRQFAEFVTSDGIRISPLYDIHHERYVVYWKNEK